MNTDDLLPLEAVAVEAGVSARTVSRRLSAGTGPQVTRLYGRSFVTRQHANEWLSRQSTATA